MIKVLLTGASGFIGSHCIEPLLALGYEVHCVSSKEVSDNRVNVVWHKANLLDSVDINNLVTKVSPSHLMHMAWYVEPGKVTNSLNNILWVEKSIELLRTFKNTGGQRSVFCGTCYEYDVQQGYCTETVTPTNPSSFYGVSKNALRQLYEKYTELAEMSGAWGRVFLLYGPNENPNRLVSSVIISLLKNQHAKCSHGEQIRDYMHVQDAADALVTLLESEHTGPYNICSGQGNSLRDIVVQIGESIGKPELIKLGAIPARADDVPLIVGDTQKFYNATGWLAKFDLEDGLEHTINWWKDNL